MITSKGFTIGFRDHAQGQDGVILLVEYLQQCSSISVPMKAQMPDIGIGRKVTSLLTQP
jgi:hypothetical protein